MSSNFLKKCLKWTDRQTDRQNIQLVEDSRSTNGSLENHKYWKYLVHVISKPGSSKPKILHTGSPVYYIY